MTKNTADKLEQKYIKKYNTYFNGYNMTIGGEGLPTIDANRKKEICNLYKKGVYIKEISNLLGHDTKVIRRILRNEGIEIKRFFGGCPTPNKIAVQAIDIKTNEVVHVFDSIFAAGLFFGLKNPNKSHIREVIDGKRKQTLGFAWRLA